MFDGSITGWQVEDPPRRATPAKAGRLWHVRTNGMEREMAKVYHDNDIDLAPILAQTVGICGYGSQGHAQAQNLRDSGVKVLVAELAGTANHKLAVEHGFKPVSAADTGRKPCSTASL